MGNTSPAKIGSIPEWKEFDFMQFWSYYIFGISPDEAEQFEKNELRQLVDSKEINIDLINEPATSELQKDTKFREELKWANQFVAFIIKNNSKINPVHVVLAMPNHLTSVGSNVEKYLARLAQIPIFEVKFNPNITNDDGEGHLRFRQLMNEAMQDAANDPVNVIKLSGGLFTAVDNDSVSHFLFTFNAINFEYPVVHMVGSALFG